MDRGLRPSPCERIRAAHGPGCPTSGVSCPGRSPSPPPRPGRQPRKEPRAGHLGVFGVSRKFRFSFRYLARGEGALAALTERLPRPRNAVLGELAERRFELCPGGAPARNGLRRPESHPSPREPGGTDDLLKSALSNPRNKMPLDRGSDLGSARFQGGITSSDLPLGAVCSPFRALDAAQYRSFPNSSLARRYDASSIASGVRTLGAADAKFAGAAPLAGRVETFPASG